MGTNHKMLRGAKSRRRPKKGPRERRRREKMQKKRLMAAGMSEASLKKMDGKAIRKLAVRLPGANA